MLFAQPAAAESDIAGFKDQVSGLVKLGAFPSAAASFVPAEWAAVARSSPHVQIERPLLEDPVLIALPADEAWPTTAYDRHGKIELGALSDLPFLTPRAGTSCSEMVHRSCARAGFVPHVAARATDFDVLLRLVGAGRGVALVPRLSVRHLPPNVRLFEPRTTVIRYISAVSTQGGYRKSAVRVVLDALSEATADLAAPDSRPMSRTQGDR